MRFPSLEVSNYRGFPRYKIEKLSRVNLLVGKNNSGKTSLLEAIQFLSSNGDPRTFMNIAQRRGETIASSERVETDISHFFYGHEIGINTKFKIQSEGDKQNLLVEIIDASELEQRQLPFEQGDTPPDYALRIQPKQNERPITSPIFSNGSFRYPRATVSTFRPFSNFISPDSLDTRQMSLMWDNVILDVKEQDVIDAMKILEPDINNIFFLVGDGIRTNSRSGIVVGVRNSPHRIPLGSFGDGMRRLLALSVGLASAQGNALLIDEIDTGLHFSIMGDLWKLVVEAARKFDVQVFATTHSFDCIRGLQWLGENYPDIMEEVAVHKIERRLDAAVTFSGQALRTALAHEIEFR